MAGDLDGLFGETPPIEPTHVLPKIIDHPPPPWIWKPWARDWAQNGRERACVAGGTDHIRSYLAVGTRGAWGDSREVQTLGLLLCLQSRPQLYPT